MNDFLFAERDWLSTKDAQVDAMCAEVDRIEADRLSNTPIEDLCASLVQKYRIDVPVLREDSIDVTHRETKVDVSHEPLRFFLDRSRPALVDGTAIEVDIPFKGDAAMFRIRPSQYTLNAPNATVFGDRLRISIVGVDLKRSDVKSRLDAAIASIKRYLDWQRKDAEAFNSTIPSLVTEHVSRRRRKLQQDQDLASSLGFSSTRQGE